MDWQRILILSMIGCGVFATDTWLALAWYWSPLVNPLFLILTKKGWGGGSLPTADQKRSRRFVLSRHLLMVAAGIPLRAIHPVRLAAAGCVSRLAFSGAAPHGRW